jgi:hypothetical protein
MSRLRSLASLVVLVLSAAACGASAPPPAAKPAPAPTPETSAPADDADAWANESAPLVVDWAAPRRAELERLLRGGSLVAVTYDSGGAKVVDGCALPGTYAYEATGFKEETLRLHGAKLGVATVGRYTTATKALYARELPAACRTATHFVKSVPTGAFAVYDELGVDLDACKVKVDPRSPPAGCRTPIRIELALVDPRSEARARCEEGDDAACSRWGTEVFGDATDATQAQPFMAKAVAMCNAGKALGCVLAASNAHRPNAPKIDERDVAERGCRLKYWGGCVELARLDEAEGKSSEALDALKSACTEGETGCGELADRVEKGPAKSKEQRQMLADLRARACLTSASDCDKYGALRKSGFVAKVDLHGAQEHVARCEELGDCFFAAAVEALGIGVPRDLTKAKKSFERYCASPAAASAPAGGKCELPRAWQ